MSCSIFPIIDTWSQSIPSKTKTSMATICLMSIPRSISGSVGFNQQRDHNKGSVEFENSTESSCSSLSSEEKEMCSREIEEDFPDLVPLLFQLEYVSLIFKLWLRRINLTRDSDKCHELQNFEHAVLTTEESVLKPYRKFLMLNQHKNVEELTSEPMVQFYCQRLEEQWTKISEEKAKTKFEMKDEDRISMGKYTVHVCSFLGLQLDFLDCLEDMPLNICGHRSLCGWVVKGLRSNYESLGFTEEDCLDKGMLVQIGFDPLSSAVDTILTRAHNMQEHIGACEWAEFFVEDEFKYNLLFSQQKERFPFQSNKTNEGFKLSNAELNLHDDNCREVNAVNLVTKESEDFVESTRSFLRKLKFEDEEHTLLFHGTDHESAIDILSGRGIHLWSGRQKRDFSSGQGFYLTKNVNDALTWASSKTVKPAIVVFRVNNRTFSDSKTRKLTLNQQEQEKWQEIVTLFRSGKQLAKRKQILREYDLIEGPLATVSRRQTLNGELMFKPKPSSYQMCLISDDFAESLEENICTVLFY